MSTLTKPQQELADLLFNTKTQAKVLRRKTLENGKFEFYDTVRDTSPIDFPINDEEFAIKIHEQIPDAPLSPIYVNLRNLPAHLIERIAKVLAEVSMNEKPDLVTGIPKTAVEMARRYSLVTGIPYMDIFEKVGTDTKRKIQTLQDASKGEGKTLLVIDDVISQGNSKFEAIKAAQDLGYKVSVLVLVDREQGGSEELEKRGVPTYAALRLPDVLDYYLEKDRISKNQQQKVLEYIAKR